MESMRATWTDTRLEEFALRVDQRFDAVDRRCDRLEHRMDAGFREVRAEIGEARDKIGAVRDDLHHDFVGLQWTIIGAGAAIFAALLGLIATQL